VSQTTRLFNAVEAVLKTGEATVLGLDDKDGETRYSVLIERAVGGSGNATAFLFISDPNKTRPPSIDALKQLFGFSNSEAKLAFGLAQGLDIKEVAESMEVTVQTARTYLKSLFEKTGANRQADLVRTLITAIPLPGSTA
jgi:DNA-binding CsgD family transcriptional regulator